MNNPILQKAIVEFEKLSTDDQNAVASRWLEELKDEQQWTKSFANTTNEQSNKLADLVRQDTNNENTISLESFLDK